MHHGGVSLAPGPGYWVLIPVLMHSLAVALLSARALKSATLEGIPSVRRPTI